MWWETVPCIVCTAQTTVRLAIVGTSDEANSSANHRGRRCGRRWGVVGKWEMEICRGGAKKNDFGDSGGESHRQSLVTRQRGRAGGCYVSDGNDGHY